MDLKLFIKRPVLSSVISIILMVVGAISLMSLPVEQYPDIAPPTIQVSATYYGASAETIQKSVIAPLEEQINGVEDMTYMTSTATNSGTADIYIYFKQGTDPDMASVNVQNRVSTATSSLPSEVTALGVSTSKKQSSMLQVFALHSPDNSYDFEFLSNYMSINLKPNIQRISGVGDVNILGNDYSMRVWMKPDVMAQYKLIPSDITAALAQQNIEAATGSFGENSDHTFQYTMKYKGRLTSPEQFGDIVIRALENGEVLKLKDIADVELGIESYTFQSSMNGHNGVNCMIYQVAGSNATDINRQIDAYLEDTKLTLPKGLEVTQIMSSNDFLFASMHEVVKTLFEAIVLVIIVVFVFLQNMRATIVPTIGIIVSLIGTFAFMSIMGFSLNLITLFALILVIGTVVDDAIVVVEAVQSKFEEGYTSPYKATVAAMDGLATAIFSTSLVFMVVFIPVSFMGGTTGTFYSQFGLTMAAAVGISMVNALTLSPAVCALILKPTHDESGSSKNNFTAKFRTSFNASFDVMTRRYVKGITVLVRHKFLPWVLLLLASTLLIYLMGNTKTGLVPDEDQGVLFVNVNTSPGSSLSTTDEIMTEIESRLLAIPEVENAGRVTGYSLFSGQGSAYGLFIVDLLDWEERKGENQDVNAVIQKIYASTADIKNATVFSMSPGMIPGYGTGNALEMHMQDKAGGDIIDFFNITQGFLAKANESPAISMAYSSFDVRYPQWLVEVDAAKALRAGIAPDVVLSTLAGYYSSQYVSDINLYTKVYKVMIEAGEQHRLDEESLKNVFVRMDNGEMAPLSQFVTLTRIYGAESLTRFNMYNSIQLNIMPADGYSSGDVIKVLREVAAETLPQGYGYDFGGMTREESEQSSSTTAIVFGICFLMIYLILSALYESYIVPFAVILAVPFGLMGSFIFAQIYGLDNNIYLQTGLIMLIGLLSKTAILITEYASEGRRSGMSITAAAISAAKARFRPILMTALAMVFGLLPLMFSSGVGANGNRSLASGTVGGMIIGTTALMFVVPAMFIFFQWLQEKISTGHVDEDEE